MFDFVKNLYFLFRLVLDVLFYFFLSFFFFVSLFLFALSNWFHQTLLCFFIQLFASPVTVLTKIVRKKNFFFFFIHFIFICIATCALSLQHRSFT